MEMDERLRQWAWQLRHDGHDWSEVATELGCTEDLAPRDGDRQCRDIDTQAQVAQFLFDKNP